MANIYGELVSAQFQQLSANPTNLIARVYYNTANNQVVWYDNTAWRIAADTASTQTLTNKTISGSSNTLTVRLTNDVTGTLPIANGGTNSGTANGALNNLLPTQTSNSGKFLTTNGTDSSWGSVTTGNDSVVTKTTTYSITASDDTVLGDATSASFTLTLPAATNTGKKIRVIRKDSTIANTLTVQKAGSDTIQGSTSISLTYQYEEVTLIADGTATWYVVARTPYAPAAMDDATATKFGHKVYSQGTSYNGSTDPTYTQSNWSTNRGFSIPYQMQDGTWRLRFHISGSFSGAANTNNFSLALNGATFKNLSNYRQACSVADENMDLGNGPSCAYVEPNSSNIFVQFNSTRNPNSRWTISGDVELESKPTFAY